MKALLCLTLDEAQQKSYPTNISAEKKSCLNRL